jgi:hypothetical protein
MSTTNNSKSILAKVLATENITVRFDPSLHTAKFDIANRVLSMPILKHDESESVTDMFIGHECAHALFSPYREKDTKAKGGWWMEAEEIGGTGNAPYVQDIMNIVEDVRIEKLMKDKFPGLRRDFSAAYRDLADRNFFGTKDKNLNDFSFIDRMNLHFKCGAFMSVPFSADEQQVVDMIDTISSFEDMVAASRKVFDFVRGRKFDAPKIHPTGAGGNPDPRNGDENAEGSGDGMTLKGDGTTDPTNGKSDNKQGEGNAPTNPDGCVENPDNKTGGQTSNPKGGTGLAPDNLLPPITTQRAFDENTQGIVDKNITSFTNLTLPVPDLSKIIFPIKKTHEIITKYYAEDYCPKTVKHQKTFNAIKESYADLVKSMNPLINTLIKQFEMKKAADLQKRTSISRTGKIDCDRIFKYKVTDDIFSRFARIAEGKNHGLVMYVDWSSSMQLATDDVITQIIMLTMFCRRMNIPFDVYAFSSQYEMFYHYGIQTKMYDSNGGCVLVKQYKDYGKYESTNRYGKVERENNQSNPGFALIHLLSSDMSKTQMNEAMFNTYLLGKMITGHGEEFKKYDCYRGVPHYFGQGNTPLDPAILCAMYMVPEFQQKHKIQIVNTIFLTDGESGYQYFQSHIRSKSDSYSQQFISKVRCPINNKEYECDDASSSDTLLRIFREVTGSTTIGFHITGSTQYCRYVTGDRKILNKNLKENGFIEAKTIENVQVYDFPTRTYKNGSETYKNHGYDRLFILPAHVEVVDDMDELDNLSSGATLARIRNTFIKSVEKRGNSRAFLNRFADVIANPSTR